RRDRGSFAPVTGHFNLPGVYDFSWGETAEQHRRTASQVDPRDHPERSGTARQVKRKAREQDAEMATLRYVRLPGSGSSV
ncbi:MAG: hypothetical protein OXF88_11255, partial [Rhodobacteraceae bacterium]|nr:hypothetical protein [Paracoccaceae bacterium]